MIDAGIRSILRNRHSQEDVFMQVTKGLAMSDATLPATTKASPFDGERRKCRGTLARPARQHLNRFSSKKPGRLKQTQCVHLALLLISAGLVIFGLWVMGPEVVYGKGRRCSWVTISSSLSARRRRSVRSYRSLASSRRHLRVSDHRAPPSAIVSDKLGSAVVQMLIYLSAISPHRLHLLLRGVSFHDARSLPTPFWLRSVSR